MEQSSILAFSVPGIPTETLPSTGTIQEETSDTLNDVEVGITSDGAVPQPRAPLPSQPGAFAVAGIDAIEYSDEETSTLSWMESLQPESATPISADLVDTAEEERKRQKELEKELAQKRIEWELGAPIAEVVPDEKCSRRAWKFGILAISLVVVVTMLGITTTLLKRKNKASTSAFSKSSLMDLLSNASLMMELP